MDRNNNIWCPQKWEVNTAQTGYTYITENLINLKGYSAAQHLFIMKVAYYQIQKRIPFVCQLDFLEEHPGYPRKNALVDQINDLLEKNVIIKFGVIKEGLARKFLLSDEFLIEMGYRPTGDIMEIIEEETKVEKSQPNHSAATIAMRERLEKLYAPETPDVEQPTAEDEEGNRLKYANTLPLPPIQWVLANKENFKQYNNKQMAYMKIAYHEEVSKKNES